MVAGGGMLMPTTFASLSISSLKKIWGGYNAAKGRISRDIAKILTKILIYQTQNKPVGLIPENQGVDLYHSWSVWLFSAGQDIHKLRSSG